MLTMSPALHDVIEFFAKNNLHRAKGCQRSQSSLRYIFPRQQCEEFRYRVAFRDEIECPEYGTARTCSFVPGKDDWTGNGFSTMALRGPTSFPVTKEATSVNSPALTERPTSRPPGELRKTCSGRQRGTQDEVSADAKKYRARMVLPCTNDEAERRETRAAIA